MKKHLHFACLVLACSLFTCKRPDRDVPKTQPEPPVIDKVEAVVKVDTVKNMGWLKSVKVEGATEVIVDTVGKTVSITLPATFTKETLFLDLETYPGTIHEVNPWDNLSTRNHIVLSGFRGSSPTTFMVVGQNKPIGKTYTVFVECKGPLTASLTSDLMLLPSRQEPYSAVEASISFDSGIGTRPEKPGSDKELTAKLIDLGTSRPVQGRSAVSAIALWLSNTTPLGLASEYALELEYGEKKFVLPGRQKLKRADLLAYPYEISNLFKTLPRNQEILLSGGYFLSDLNYRVKVESAFHPSLWLSAKYRNPSMLAFTTPAELADGSYLVSLYEGESIVQAFNFNVSGDAKPKGIRSISTETMSCPPCTSRDVTLKNLSFLKGKPMFVAPFPAILGSFYGAFDPNQKLPDLELKNAQGKVVIKAKIRADGSYANATTQLYFGEYLIPTNLASGDYEARLLYDDSKNTIPFWSLIEIN